MTTKRTTQIISRDEEGEGKSDGRRVKQWETERQRNRETETETETETERETDK